MEWNHLDNVKKLKKAEITIYVIEINLSNNFFTSHILYIHYFRVVLDRPLEY